jgi:hypothetical protein
MTVLPEDLTGGPPWPPGSEGHIAHHEEIHAQLNAGLSEYVNFAKYGGVADGVTDNTAAIQAAVDEAVATGKAGVIAPIHPDTADHFLVMGRVNFHDRILVGRGPNATVFEMGHADAGFDFVEFGEPGTPTGHSHSFAVWGGPGLGAGIATRPLIVGSTVSSRFSNIHSWYAHPTSGINFLCLATQNTMFDTIYCADAAENLRLDAGCSYNLFSKCEFVGGHTYNVGFRQSAEYPNPPSQFAYNAHNCIENSIFEGPSSTTDQFVYHVAGAMNHLRQCALGVNSVYFGYPVPTAMASTIYTAPAESAQSTLVAEDQWLNGEDLAGLVGFHAENGSTIWIRGGVIQKIPTVFKGNIRIQEWPRMLTTAGSTEWVDTSTVFPNTPFQELPTYQIQYAEDAAATVRSILIRGEGHTRWSINAAGAMSAGSGAAAQDTGLLGRTAANEWGATRGLACAGTWVYPFRMGSSRLWVDATGDLRIKAGVPSSDTDGTVVGTQS